MAQKRKFTKLELDAYQKIFQEHSSIDNDDGKGFIDKNNLLKILSRTGIPTPRLELILGQASGSESFSRTQFAHALQLCAFEQETGRFDSD